MFIKCQIHTRFACYREGRVLTSLCPYAQRLRSENAPGCDSFRAPPHDRLLTPGARGSSSDTVPADVSPAYSSPSPGVPALEILKLRLCGFETLNQGSLGWRACSSDPLSQRSVSSLTQKETGCLDTRCDCFRHAWQGKPCSASPAHPDTLPASQSLVKTLMSRVKSLPQWEIRFLHRVPCRIFLSRC